MEFHQSLTLPSGLEVGKTPITRKQWIAVVGPGTEPQRLWEAEGWSNTSLDCPVTHVSWSDTKMFCARIGDGWRLPTCVEQREYLYPLHSTFSFSDHVVGDLPYEAGPPEVGTKKPMPNGLLDSHGLIVEWTSNNTLFGSVWYKHPLVFSSADLGWSAIHRYSNAGFRVVRREHDTN